MRTNIMAIKTVAELQESLQQTFDQFGQVYNCRFEVQCNAGDTGSLSVRVVTLRTLEDEVEYVAERTEYRFEFITVDWDENYVKILSRIIRMDEYEEDYEHDEMIRGAYRPCILNAVYTSILQDYFRT